jgi:hypothetical protein
LVFWWRLWQWQLSFGIFHVVFGHDRVIALSMDSCLVVFSFDLDMPDTAAMVVLLSISSGFGLALGCCNRSAF